MGKILRLTIIFALIVNAYHLEAQVAPYALSPRWVFGNKGEFDFTSGSLVQVARTDNIIANEGSSTLCLPSKALLTFDNNVRVGGSNHTPLGTVMNSSSSATQGGLILPNPNVAAGTSFFWITANAEAAYTAQEPNDVVEQGWRAYSGSQSGATVTAPTLAATLTTNVTASPWESLYSSSDGNYGYYILSGGAKPTSTGDIVLNKWNLSSTGTFGGISTATYATNWYNSQAQASVKINRCQTKIAIVNGGKLGVFNWDRTTGTLGAVIKDMNITIGGGGKLYGVEFSPNGNYVFVTTLNGDKLSVVDLTAGGTGGGETLINGNWSGSLQLAPDNIIYVANGLDGTAVNSVGTIVNPNSGGGATFNASGLALANSSTVRLGIANIPWLNPQKPTATIVNNSCGSYTFTPVFLTHYSDVIGYTKAIWDFGDGTATVTNTGANADDAVTHVYATGSTGNKTITLTLTDGTCSQDWTGTVVQNVPCILPVELISFDAYVKNDGINVTWATATEINNDYFELQRSTDGVNFKTITKIAGYGNSGHVVNYSYLDKDAVGTKVYYKLVQHDFDGKFEESKIVLVNLDKSSLVPVSISPNPFSDSFVLMKLRDEKATIVVYDIIGRVLENKTSSEAETSIQLGAGLSNGTYIVEYITTENSYSVRVEKQ